MPGVRKGKVFICDFQKLSDIWNSLVFRYVIFRSLYFKENEKLYIAFSMSREENNNIKCKEHAGHFSRHMMELHHLLLVYKCISIWFLGNWSNDQIKSSYWLKLDVQDKSFETLFTFCLSVGILLTLMIMMRMVGDYCNCARYTNQVVNVFENMLPQNFPIKTGTYVLLLLNVKWVELFWWRNLVILRFPFPLLLFGLDPWWCRKVYYVIWNIAGMPQQHLVCTIALIRNSSI